MKRYISPEEHMHAEVRVCIRDLSLVLLPYIKYSEAGKTLCIYRRLKEQYVNDKMLDDLLTYYPRDAELHAAVNRCREALNNWKLSGGFTSLVNRKLRNWLS